MKMKNKKIKVSWVINRIKNNKSVHIKNKSKIIIKTNLNLMVTKRKDYLVIIVQLIRNKLRVNKILMRNISKKKSIISN